MYVGLSDQRLTKRHRDGSWIGSLRNRWELGQARAVDWTLSQLGLSSAAVLVSGFLRSGTTWVQECLAECLAAKTVFEPLSPLDPRRRAMLTRDTSAFPDVMHGIIPGPWAVDDPVWPHLMSASQARHGSRFSMTCRRGRRESISRRIVLKDVRLQFNLLPFHQRFGVPVLHVSRDPRAVVASLRRARWGWSFDGLSLADILPDDAEVWKLQTIDREELIVQCDRDGLSRIAAMWAVTERFVSLSLEGQPWAKQVNYEDFVSAPEPSILEVSRWLGIAADRLPDFARRSASDHPDAERTRPPFPSPWQEALPAQDASEVMRIVHLVHPGWLRPTVSLQRDV